MTDRSCLICRGQDFRPYGPLLRKCNRCGFVTAHLNGPLNITEVYDDSYYSGSEFLNYKEDETFFRRNFRRRLSRILKERAGGRLLEIGSAYGFFLDVAKEHFDVVGFEVNDGAARYARESLGVDVRTESFLETSLEDVGGPVDITVMWDVIEHLEQPDLFLDRIRDVSAPGADLFITTGDIGSVVARFRGPRWRMIHPPTHLHYFNRETLFRLLEDHGFEVVKCRAVGFARSMRQIVYAVLVLKLGWNAVYRTVEPFVRSGWGFYLDLFDIMMVHAKKSSRLSEVSGQS